MHAFLLDQLKQFPVPRRYIVALSGGCDSVALLHAMRQIQSQLPCPILQAVHIDHGLQAASTNWSQQCQQLCRQLEVPIHIIELHLDIPKGESLEAVARHARYAAFEDYLQDDDMLLLAHHRNDQAETLLLQVLRGSGVTGLACMPKLIRNNSAWLVRPLLDIGRNDIEQYARAQALSWIDDPSNQDTRFDRNFLRHDIMPLLQARWPSVNTTLARVAHHQAEASHLLNELAQIDWQTCCAPDKQRLSVSAVQKLPPARIRNLLRYWVAHVAHLPMPDTVHLQRILDEVLPAAQDATPLGQWAGVHLRRYRDELYLEHQPVEHAVDWHIAWDMQGPMILPTGETLSMRMVRGGGLRLDPPTGPVTVQFRQGGERCRLPGRAHHNELKKLLQSWGVPPWRRDRIPLIFVDQELAQIVGFSLCEPYIAQADQLGVEIYLQE